MEKCHCKVNTANACVGRGHGCRMRGMLRSSYLLILSIQPALLLSSCLITTQDNANNNNGLYHLLHQNGKVVRMVGKKCSELLPHYVLLIASVCFAICVELSWYLFWLTIFRVGFFIWDKIVIYSQLTFPTD